MAKQGLIPWTVNNKNITTKLLPGLGYVKKNDEILNVCNVKSSSVKKTTLFV